MSGVQKSHLNVDYFNAIAYIYVADLNLTQLQTQKVAKNLHLNEAVQLEYYRQARISLSHVLLYFCELIER